MTSSNGTIPSNFLCQAPLYAAEPWSITLSPPNPNFCAPTQFARVRDLQTERRNQTACPVSEGGEGYCFVFLFSSHYQSSCGSEHWLWLFWQPWKVCDVGMRFTCLSTRAVRFKNAAHVSVPKYHSIKPKHTAHFNTTTLFLSATRSPGGEDTRRVTVEMCAPRM